MLVEGLRINIWPALCQSKHGAKGKELFWPVHVSSLPGEMYDAETGLHYTYHRYYDPKTGRYLTPDPIGQFGGLNLYPYVDNNPINTVDPHGNIGIPGAIVGTVSGGVGGFITGGWKGAVLGSLIGGGVGFLAPTASYSVGSILGSAASAGLANVLGQIAGNVVNKSPEFQFSPLSFVGAAVGGAFAPFYAGVSASLAGGSLIVEGIMSGVATGYFELAGWLFDNFEQYLLEYNRRWQSLHNGCGN